MTHSPLDATAARFLYAILVLLCAILLRKLCSGAEVKEVAPEEKAVDPLERVAFLEDRLGRLEAACRRKGVKIAASDYEADLETRVLARVGAEDASLREVEQPKTRDQGCVEVMCVNEAQQGSLLAM